jgi:hypothetical protein
MSRRWTGRSRRGRLSPRRGAGRSRLAVVAIAATLRRLWRLQHPCRWQYLPVALALTLLIGLFVVIDARVLVY